MDCFRLFRVLSVCAVLLWVLLFCRCVNASGEGNDSDWASAKARFEELGQEGECEKLWNVLWPWAKAGNLEARLYLFLITTPPPDVPFAYPPGSDGSYIERIRDSFILSIHSYGYEFESEDMSNMYHKERWNIYEQLGIKNTMTGRRFLECIKEESRDCVDIAVKEKIVPSFHDYARGIDMFLDRGFGSTCSEHKSIGGR